MESEGGGGSYSVSDDVVGMCFVKVRRRVYLEGEELEKFKQKEREEKLARQQAEK